MFLYLLNHDHSRDSIFKDRQRDTFWRFVWVFKNDKDFKRSNDVDDDELKFMVWLEKHCITNKQI